MTKTLKEYFFSPTLFERIERIDLKGHDRAVGMLKAWYFLSAVLSLITAIAINAGAVYAFKHYEGPKQGEEDTFSFTLGYY